MGKRSREKKEKSGGGEITEKESKFEFRSKLEKTCLFIITWGTYLVLFTPLVINTKFFFPFVAPKTVFFRIIVEIILASYLLLVVANKYWRPRINALTISVTLFLVIFILASFTGVNLERSFWSTNERMTGILTMLHLFAFFIVLSSVFKNKKDWEKILGVSIMVGAALSIYILIGKEISTRGGGTVGNTSFMAAYLLFDVFFALILFFSNFLKKGGRSLSSQIFLGMTVLLPVLLVALAIKWPVWGQILLGIILFIPALFIERVFRKGEWPLFWQIFSGLSLAVMLPVLLNSTGRGAIAAFFGGLFLLGLVFLFFSRKKILKRTAWAVVLILIILGTAAAVFQPSFVTEETSVTLQEMKSRFVVWESGWKGFLEKPVLGWGPENFIVVFSNHFNPCMFLSECGTEIWFDRVHNIVLDTLVTTGLVGFLSYFAVFIVAIYGLLRAASRVSEKRNIFFPLGLAVILMVYFFQNLLVFDMINTYLVFFLCLSFVYFLTQKETEEKEVRGRVNPIFVSIIIGIATFVFWTTNIQPMMANSYVIKMVSSQEVNESSLFFQKSLDSWMDKYETREQFTQKIYRAAYQSIPEEGKESLQKAFDLAEIEMEKSIEQNYLDFRPHLFLGELYVSSYRLSGKEEKIVKAEQLLEKAIQLSPANQQGYWNLAEAKLAQGKISETISLLKKAVDLEPRLGYSHWYLALAYKIAGQNQLAKEEVVNAKKNGFNWDEDMENLKKAINIYLSVNDYESLIPLYLRAIELDPSDAEFWANLAASYANTGRIKEAREVAQKVIEINPDLAPKVQEFLKSLPQ